MDMKFKKILPYALVVLFFLVAAYAFVPQVLTGKIVNQSDISGYVGMSHEMNEWNKEHPDDPTSWTDSMFGGMPTTTISAPRKGDWTQVIYDTLLTGKRPATYLFIAMLGGFLLLLSLGADLLLAAGGAVAMAFCSYNFQIIQVGHNTKMQAIAFLPWALAAFVFTYRRAFKKGKNWKEWLPGTLLGAVLFAFAVSFQVKANHQQITYYLALMLVIYALVLFVRLAADKARRGLLGRFFAASALLVVMGLAGIATNANKLVPVYKYTAQSMRGGSELASASNAASGGLTLDYATAWSYGWEELPNLMIPNFNGGSSSGAVNPRHSATAQLFKDAGYNNYRSIVKALPLYWGPQPFTAGPMYMGAITVFLFILGLLLCRPKDKWWVVICTLLAIFLALGSHFIGFTKFFYDHVPFYNKFRTVSMALVVLQTTLPVLGFLALDRILKGEPGVASLRKKGIIAYAVTAGFCLLMLLVPSLAGPFTGSGDAGQQDILVDALIIDRVHLLRMDALRSLVLISAAFLLILWGYSLPKAEAAEGEEGSEAPAEREPSPARRRIATLLVCALVIVDLFAAGKRYLSSDDFVTPRAFNNQFNKTYVDEAILEDTAVSYRILDLTVSPFNNSRRSYWHKNIGGYSPAKLQRYQELIDAYLTQEIESIIGATKDAETVTDVEDRLPELPVLSALNLKYIIIDDEVRAVVNNGAYGNAWFVDGTVAAGSPDEALALVGATDLRHGAVLEPADAGAFGAFGAPAPGDSIAMTSYAPNELHFRYSTSGDRMAVFSEVYYPEGWHAWLADTGADVPVLRADWILRAAVLPAGDHELVMRFDPKSVSESAAVSRASSICIILLLLLAAAGVIVFKPGKEEDGSQS